MSKLYDLVGDFLTLYNMADDFEDNADVWFDTLEGIEGELEDKAENYGKLIKNLEADIAAYKAEEQRFHAKRSAMENKVENLKRRLTEAMILTDKRKIQTDHFSFTVQKNPASAFIADESRVPEQFLIPQDPKIDKKSIISWLKEGNVCDWAELTQGESVRMR